MAFRKVIFFIYQKINSSDRVPLSFIFNNLTLLYQSVVAYIIYHISAKESQRKDHHYLVPMHNIPEMLLSCFISRNLQRQNKQINSELRDENKHVQYLDQRTEDTGGPQENKVFVLV